MTSKKILSKAEQEEKKSRRKALVICLAIVAVIAPLIWFSGEYFAKESEIGRAFVTIDGKEKIIRFTQKGGSYTKRNHDGTRETGNSHYGYFLELIDSTSHSSLCKIKFKSPVWTIQKTPEMIVYPNGDVWLVSSAWTRSRDIEGFILKFSVNNDTIINLDFKLDEKYGIHNIDEDKVALSTPDFNDTYYDKLFGGIYLDLKTGKIVDNREERKKLMNAKPTVPY